MVGHLLGGGKKGKRSREEEEEEKGDSIASFVGVIIPDDNDVDVVKQTLSLIHISEPTRLDVI
eukprot:6284364-Prorocentrum_lima.AAC.1